MRVFRPYTVDHRDACLNLFDANCPDYFAPNERDDYAGFLDGVCEGYEVCVLDGRIAAAFGLIAGSAGENRLCWIMIDPAVQGAGLGSAIMRRVIERGRSSQLPLIGIAASHKSAPFFARFGAKEINYTEDGWGPGMHRVDMELDSAIVS